LADVREVPAGGERAQRCKLSAAQTARAAS
jgi:hypothetical protein